MLPWLLPLLGIAALAVAFTTASVMLSGVCLLAALALLAVWIGTLLAARVDSRTRDSSLLIDPQELQRMRALADSRRTPAAGSPAPGEAPPR